MQTESEFFEVPDGTRLFLHRWRPEAGVVLRGAVQIVHGMAEHGQRYERFAGALTGAGFEVYALDLRGHGRTAGEPKNVGFFAEAQGWEKVVDDVHQLCVHIRHEHPGLPLVLFGHSMGSFLARHAMILHGAELDGVMLSGTAGDPGLLGAAGLTAARAIAGLHGARTPSPLLDQLTFGAYNKPFAPARTRFDWLSRDTAQVDRYVADAFCGGIFSAGFFCDLLGGLRFIHQPANLARIPKALPVYLFSGERDPVGAQTRGVRQVHQLLERSGLTNLTMRFYPDGRHEMLNETNWEEVHRDVLAWLASVTQRGEPAAKA